MFDNIKHLPNVGGAEPCVPRRRESFELSCAVVEADMPVVFHVRGCSYFLDGLLVLVTVRIFFGF